ncbi:hypothetical protein ACFRH4_08625 [Streptomyces mirabilis]|uniref:hypothetical protein n=1 Tax=Streptomyces mirabilis TaxID=68239 RepID=UPI0036AA2629
MSSPTLTLNDLIRTRLEEIAEDAWLSHRVMGVTAGNGRLLEFGSAAVRERWYCQGDHGNGLCGESLLTATQASTLLGMVADDDPVPDPVIPAVEIELLNPDVGGFLLDVLFHFSDVAAEFRKAQG